MLQIEGPYFKDKRGRTLMLRGINLGGNSRVPHTPRLPSHEFYGVYTEKVSFVDHPFPLKEADKHFKRLQSWGFNFIRFLVTWEALESAGPGEYDEKYLDYVHALLKKAGEYGLMVIIDPHQDAWSRFCGGNGAPKWTHDLVGLNVEQFTASEAAVLHHHQKDDYPHMIWPTNYTKLACATMFTLFFGGNHFAPQLKIGELGIQDYLQQHYINAFSHLAKRLQDLPHVIGFEVMNDPSPGWIGHKDLKSYAYPLKKGICPSPLECMILGAGNPQQIERWDTTSRGPKSLGKAEANPRGIKVWAHGHSCIWKAHGVWKMADLGEPTLIQPDYFSKIQGREVDFQKDYLLPFMEKFARHIRENLPDALIYLRAGR
ncbi:MAG: cellulase family glycosylhydrolase [Bacteroidota bacterium]